MTLQWFRDTVGQTDCMPEHLADLLFSSLEPIYDAHCLFLQDVEQRLTMWYVFYVVGLATFLFLTFSLYINLMM
jgi:hypothetical protein